MRVSTQSYSYSSSFEYREKISCEMKNIRKNIICVDKIDCLIQLTKGSLRVSRSILQHPTRTTVTRTTTSSSQCLLSHTGIFCFEVNSFCSLSYFVIPFAIGISILYELCLLILPPLISPFGD